MMFPRFVLAALVFLASTNVYAGAKREFMLSCTYGVLAGALVGAATLAVEEDPDDKLHRVARGASLGLYAGIILGLYVIYWVPGQGESSQDAEEELEQYEDEEYDEESRLFKPPRFTIYPVIEKDRGITGAGVNINVMTF